MAVYVNTATGGGADGLFMPADANSRPFYRNHNTPFATPGYPSGVNSMIYYSSGPERPEVILDRTYVGAYNQPYSTYIGDRIYVLGPSPDERLVFQDMGPGGVAGTVYYPHTDRQGSTIALSTAGSSVQTFTYDAYGQPQPANTYPPTNNYPDVGPGASAYPYLYTGQRYDPAMLAYDYKARIYSALDGRFWQPDDIGPKDDINLYTYTHNSPLNGTDPSGNCESILPCKGDEGENPLHREISIGGSDGGLHQSMNQNESLDTTADDSGEGGGDGGNTRYFRLNPDGSKTEITPLEYMSCMAKGECVIVEANKRPQGAMSPNQMNRAVQRGQAPKGIGRTDTGKVKGEQQHTVINSRGAKGAINLDGTWKHGGGTLTSEQAAWLRAQGYQISE
jgi:RHS repeat-associated protein